MRLYDLTADLAALMDRLYESGGEISPEVEADLAALLDARADKARDYIAVIRQAEASAAAVRFEVERLTARLRAYETTARNLKSRLQASMEDTDTTRIETSLGVVRLQRNPDQCVVTVPLESLPERFQRVSITANVTALRDALKAGDPEAVAVATMEQRGYHLRIQ